MARLRLESIHKRFADGTAALRDVDLDVSDGELLALVGPSGCGKSTLLRIIAGLEAPTQGRVWIDDEDVTRLSPAERDLGMVFQSYALYPHKTVRENLAFGLRVRQRPRAEIDARVAEVAGALGLADLLERRPSQLSGGQRQRVALGRAIARRARAFLLDEPLSNLDAQLRHDMRAELLRLQRDLGATLVYVTHDQEEALTLGDRLGVLRDGRLEQLGRPDEVFRRPCNTFVAGFLGAPGMNLLEARVTACGELYVDGCPLRIEGARWPAAEGGGERRVLLGVRPPDVHVAGSAPAHAEVRVDLVQYTGTHHWIHARLGGTGQGPALILGAPARERPAPGDRLPIRLDPEALHLFDPESRRRLAPPQEACSMS